MPVSRHVDYSSAVYHSHTVHHYQRGVPLTDMVQSTIRQYPIRTRNVPVLESWPVSFDFVAVDDVAVRPCEKVIRTVD